MQIGLATINLCEDRLAYFTNLTTFANPIGSMANDVIQVGTKIYVTDFLGSQVLIANRLTLDWRLIANWFTLDC